MEVLKTYEHDSVKSILIWNFDDSVISLLPEGEVPYSGATEQTVYSGSLSENLAREARGGESATGQDLDGRGRTSLRREYQNLYHFVKGGNNTLSTIRREMMFINILEGLHPKESEILILAKDLINADSALLTSISSLFSSLFSALTFASCARLISMSSDHSAASHNI